jgi:hypothetical protein
MIEFDETWYMVHLFYRYYSMYVSFTSVSLKAHRTQSLMAMISFCRLV